ncbi:MAG: DNA primase [Butyrivibrio sp.]|nr:DNA primase [Butyrivibrio sp.]
MSVFETVKANVTARQVAEFYGIKVNHYGMCCCPFHSDKHPSMKIDKRYYCFGCLAKGDAVDFVLNYFGLSLKDAAIKICDDFSLSHDNSYHAPIKNIKPEKSDEQIFKETCNHCYKVLSDYLHLLKKWRIEYRPKDESSEWHPYFCEALKEIDHVKYLLDTLLYGDISDRAFLIKNYGKKVIDIERRLNEYESRDAAKDKGSC